MKIEEVERNILKIAEEKYCEAYIDIWLYIKSISDDCMMGETIYIKLNGKYYKIPFPLKLLSFYDCKLEEVEKISSKT